jgi:cytochrome P450
MGFNFQRNLKCNFFLGREAPKIFLDLLFEASENGNTLSDEEVREEVETFMFAVSDKVFQKSSIAVL